MTESSPGDVVGMCTDTVRGGGQRGVKVRYETSVVSIEEVCPYTGTVG